MNRFDNFIDNLIGDNMPILSKEQYKKSFKYNDLPCKLDLYTSNGSKYHPYRNEDYYLMESAYNNSYEFYLDNMNKLRKNKIRKIISRFRKLLNQKKSLCIKKNIPYNLDLNWYVEKLILGCSLTGIDFEIVNLPGKKGPYSPYQPSIDRIDSKKGYIKENCRLILFCLNLYKMQFNDEHIFRISEKLLELEGHRE